MEKFDALSGLFQGVQRDLKETFLAVLVQPLAADHDADKSRHTRTHV